MKETQHIEWKESWRDEYLKWISGFANAKGGVLVIGKNDAGKVVGVADAKRLLVDLPNKVQSVLGIQVAVNLRRSAGKETIEIVVDPYSFPVSYKGEYHVRSGSTKQELKGAALAQFLLKKHGLHWDEIPVPRAVVADLDTKTLAWFRQQALKSKRLSAEIVNEPDAALLDKLHLVDGAHLKRAAVLLFHPDPERYVTGAFIKIGYFDNNVDLRYQDEVHGDLFAQVSQTIEVLTTKYLKGLISYEGVQRIETYPVPDAALREALLNAIVHKDYASAIPLQISVYADKLMIWNPGQLPSEWTVEKLLTKHASRPFNPGVAGAFFQSGMIESWGRGVEKMVAACAEAGVPEPTFQTEVNGLWTVFRFAPAYIKAMQPVSTTQETTQKTTQKTRVKTPVKTPVKKRVKTQVKTPDQLLDVLTSTPSATLSDVAALIGKSLSAVERAAAKLVLEKRLRFVGPRKGGHWEVIK